MARSLTPKQEKFAQVYIETGNASEAYRQAYNAENMSAKTVWEEANKLVGHPKVSPRVSELQAEHKERHNVTVDGITALIVRAYEKAAGDPKGAAAMVSAAMGLGKLHGLVVDKQLHGEDKDNPLPTKVLVQFGNDS